MKTYYSILIKPIPEARPCSVFRIAKVNDLHHDIYAEEVNGKARLMLTLEQARRIFTSPKCVVL